jgi:hypothetical protein
MIAVAWLLRLVVAAFLYRELLDPSRDHWHFGWEVGQVARSIALQQGFGSPLHGWTGPTAMLPPVYAYLFATVFRFFGLFTSQSAFIMLAINGLFSALTCIPIFLSTQRVLGADAAKYAGWTWAFYPYAIYFSAGRVWDYALTTLVLAFCFWAVQELPNRDGWMSWLGFGVLWGAAALVNPGVLATFPFLLALAAFKLAKRRRVWLAHSLAAVFGVGLVMAPWMARNYVLMGIVCPIRDNFWMEFWVGNTGDLSDLVPDWAHPATSPVEMEKFRSEGEVNYIAHKRELALQFLHQRLGLFLALTARRIAYYWTGYWSFQPAYLGREPTAVPNLLFCTALTMVMLRGIWRWWRCDREAVIPYIVMIASFPLVYYITHPLMDYRQAIEPYVVVLIIAGWYSFQGKREELSRLGAVGA